MFLYSKPIENNNLLKKTIPNILNHYRESFSTKIHNEENIESDLLMEIFGITSKIKLENKQYWGRELGLCWQKIITEIIKTYRDDYIIPEKFGKQELFDTGFAQYAIDTKYRIGSGDSGTIKKFKEYAKKIKKIKKTPVLLILRTDNLEYSIKACQKAGWIAITGEQSLNFIKTETGFDLKEFLKLNKNKFSIKKQ